MVQKFFVRDMSPSLWNPYQYQLVPILCFSRSALPSKVRALQKDSPDRFCADIHSTPHTWFIFKAKALLVIFISWLPCLFWASLPKGGAS